MAGRGRRLLRSGADRLGLHLATKERYDLVPRTYYSPLPNFDELPDDIWDRRTRLSGVEFDTAAQMEFCERELAEYARELDAPEHLAPDGTGFHFENTMYEHGDAEIAYAMVRRFKPRQVMELGSGFSTLVLARACAANEAEEHPARLVSNDPYERGLVDRGLPGLAEITDRAAQDIPVEDFAHLQNEDILFVDTTHVVKLGSDVNHVILEVLPTLAPGVIVHFHDIWLPDEYHRALTEILGQHWTEQYLLQAFLSGNARYEVLCATHAVATRHPDRFQAAIPGYTGENYPSSFWLRVSDDG